MSDFVRNKASETTDATKVFRVKKKAPLVIDENIRREISMLPSNYNFEIEKTLEKLSKEKPSVVALQFPEGLQMYACIIANIITKFSGAKVLIMGDVTYGACCIDDFTDKKLGAELLIHYGHSCLVPLQVTQIKVLYVFVEISFDITHLISIIRANFNSTQRIAVMGTIQFVSSLYGVRKALKDDFPNLMQPQCKPLSSGETLGCTSAVIPDCDVLIFLADGRFHLEAAMIQNPSISAYRYDPYNKVLSREGYDHHGLLTRRSSVIAEARSCQVFGVVLGSLGRQGNLKLFQRLQTLLRRHGKTVIPFIMAEIQPAKIAKLTKIEAWVQVACPRLSIDWGLEFDKPLLNAYELEVCLGETEWKPVYPMDYYSASGGSWTNYAQK